MLTQNGLLYNPRVAELANSVFLHSCFMVLLSITMEKQLLIISQQIDW